MQSHRGETIAERDGLKVIDCVDCSYAHLAEMPSTLTLERFYHNEFWQREKAGALSRFEAQARWWSLTHGDWLTALEAHTNGRTLHDVGCGYGQFMRAAFSRGWQVSGVEPSEAAARVAEAMGVGEIWRGTWENDGFDGVFSVISALWLVEHLPYPLSFLRWCKDNLGSDGALLVVVPNEFSALQLEANKKAAVKDYWVHHTHMNYFTPATLGNLLGRAGFRVVDKLATYPMETFILAGRDYTADEAVGAACHEEVEDAEERLTRDARLDAIRQAGLLGAGRDLVWIAKPE